MRSAKNRNPTRINKIKNNLGSVAGCLVQNKKQPLFFFYLNIFLHQNSIYLCEAVATWQPYKVKFKISYLQQHRKEKKQPKIIII